MYTVSKSLNCIIQASDWQGKFTHCTNNVVYLYKHTLLVCVSYWKGRGQNFSKSKDYLKTPSPLLCLPKRIKDTRMTVACNTCYLKMLMLFFTSLKAVSYSFSCRTMEIV